MKLTERAYEIAKKELGVKEVPGPGDNPRIIEYLKAVDFNDETPLHDSIPHCSAFVNWCLQQAGGKGTRSAMARSFLGWGIETKTPKEGDIVVFKRGGSKSKGHVGMVVEVLPLYVKCLGANQSDMVCIQQYNKTLVLGYRTSND